MAVCLFEAWCWSSGLPWSHGSKGGLQWRVALKGKAAADSNGRCRNEPNMNPLCRAGNVINVAGGDHRGRRGKTNSMQNKLLSVYIMCATYICFRFQNIYLKMYLCSLHCFCMSLRFEAQNIVRLDKKAWQLKVWHQLIKLAKKRSPTAHFYAAIFFNPSQKTQFYV